MIVGSLFAFLVVFVLLRGRAFARQSNKGGGEAFRDEGGGGTV